METMKTSVGGGREESRDVESRENILDDIVMIHTCCYRFALTH